MNLNRMPNKTALKSGMSLLELSVLMAAFLLILAISMIGVTAWKDGAGGSGDEPSAGEGPKRRHLPAKIAVIEERHLSVLAERHAC